MSPQVVFNLSFITFFQLQYFSCTFSHLLELELAKSNCFYWISRGKLDWSHMFEILKLKLKQPPKVRTFSSLHNGGLSNLWDSGQDGYHFAAKTVDYYLFIGLFYSKWHSIRRKEKNLTNSWLFHFRTFSIWWTFPCKYLLRDTVILKIFRFCPLFHLTCYF